MLLSFYGRISEEMTEGADGLSYFPEPWAAFMWLLYVYAKHNAHSATKRPLLVEVQSGKRGMAPVRYDRVCVTRFGAEALGLQGSISVPKKWRNATPPSVWVSGYPGAKHKTPLTPSRLAGRRFGVTLISHRAICGEPHPRESKL